MAKEVVEVKKLNVTGIILAGGKSSRMGTNKALLRIDHTTVIEKIVEEMKAVTTELIVVTNHFEDYEFLGLPLVADLRKNMGPLAGLEAGLMASSNENNLIIACDMPFVSQTLAKTLIQHLEHFDAVVPRIEGKLNPLFAAYRKSCLEEIQHSLDDNQLKMRSFLDRIKLKIIDDESLQMALFNMNTPEEYEKAIQYDKMNEKNRRIDPDEVRK
ncbi:molybdenum cofactor guanylyltransferase [Bacillus sp. CGMCC 1.16607]|uniref:molybdenum cofactor guanylyltransferase n=1 Tax=Bacillus sp. CGMCC 1.16607 TaxID=3351842 RepID=UPI00363ECAA4